MAPRVRNRQQEEFPEALTDYLWLRLKGLLTASTAPERVHAIEGMTVMRAPRYEDDLPVGPAPRWQPNSKTGGAICKCGEDVRFRLENIKNPRPHSSFGFLNRFVEVKASGSFRNAVLKIAFDQKAARRVIPHTVRVFRWDEGRQEFYPIMRSGVDPNLT